MRFHAILFALSAFLVMSCSSTQPLPVIPEAGLESPVYRLMPGDVLDIHITQREDLSGEYVLGPDGSLFLPEIGRVQLSGKRQEEAQLLVNDLLRSQYKTISANLRIVQYQSNASVVILGEVRQPGTYPIRNTLTITELLGEANGSTEHADLRRIRVVRNNLHGSSYRVNLKRFIHKADHNQDLILESGDVVMVPRRPLRSSFLATQEMLNMVQFGLVMLLTVYQLGALTS